MLFFLGVLLPAEAIGPAVMPPIGTPIGDTQEGLCGFINAGGFWNVTDCTETKAFICERAIGKVY